MSTVIAKNATEMTRSGHSTLTVSFWRSPKAHFKPLSSARDLPYSANVANKVINVTSRNEPGGKYAKAATPGAQADRWTSNRTTTEFAHMRAGETDYRMTDVFEQRTLRSLFRVALFYLVSSLAVAANHYSVKDLGTMSLEQSVATGIDPAGTVTGVAITNKLLGIGDVHPFVWSTGARIGVTAGLIAASTASGSMPTGRESRACVYLEGRDHARPE